MSLESVNGEDAKTEHICSTGKPCPIEAALDRARNFTKKNPDFYKGHQAEIIAYQEIQWANFLAIVAALGCGGSLLVNGKAVCRHSETLDTVTSLQYGPNQQVLQNFDFLSIANGGTSNAANDPPNGTYL